MSTQEAAFFYGDYSELSKEFARLLDAEKVSGPIPHEEILT